MSYRSRLFFRYAFAPVCIMFLYVVIIYAGMSIGYMFEGEQYTKHMGEVAVYEGFFGLIIMTAWILIKRRLILPGPRWAIGKPYDWGFAVVGALAALGISMLYMVTVEHIPFASKALEDYSSTMDEIYEYTRSEIYLQVFASCLLIPVMEEMMFRGCVLEGMLEFKRPYLAVFLSAAFFGAMHMQPVHIGYAFLCGIVLGLIYYYTKNICMSILAHVIFNCLGSGLCVLFQVPDLAEKVILIVEYISIVGFAVGIYFMAKAQKNRFTDEIEESGDFNKMLPGRHT